MNYQRKVYGFGFILCAIALLFAYYLEHGQLLEPCPLCMLSRGVVVLLGLQFLVAYLHSPKKTGLWMYGVLGASLSLIGILISARHVWLQSLPPELAPDCGPGLEYLFNVLPPLEAIQHVLTGSGECTKILWSFAGLSLPAWTLFLFFVWAVLWLLPLVITRVKKG